MNNNIELNILKYLLDYDIYTKYRRFINLDYIRDYNKDLYKLYQYLDRFLLELNKSSSIEEFRTYVLSVIDEKDAQTYNAILDTCDKADVSKEGIEIVLKNLKRKELSLKLSLAFYDISQGRGSQKDLDKLREEYSSTEANGLSQNPAFGIKEVSEDIEAVIEHQISKPGLRWPLDCLNKALGSLRKGDFGFVFARPETGKTTFMAHTATFMATQAQSPVLWINNEEQGEKVRIRLVQAALGATLQAVQKIKAEGKGKLNEAYKARIGPGIRLLDDASISKSEIERFLLSMPAPPCLIIIDQIDKISGFEADREDLRLGTIYQWARELAKTYAPVIAVCQADGSGEGEKWLTMGNVANAKTSKQAEADFIIGIGMIHDNNYEKTRFINISKNKLTGDEDHRPELRHGKFQVVIQPEIGRYKDIMEY